MFKRKKRKPIDLKKGDWIVYSTIRGESALGRFKSESNGRSDDDYCFVVFNCGGDWSNFTNYTGVYCNKGNLRTATLDDLFENGIKEAL